MFAVKSFKKFHKWQVIKQHLEEPGIPDRWGRSMVECSKCGEAQRIYRGVDINGKQSDPLQNDTFRRGCVRKSFRRRFRQWDVVRVLGRLDFFDRYLGDGKAQTHNVNTTFSVHVGELVPCLPKDVGEQRDQRERERVAARQSSRSAESLTRSDVVSVTEHVDLYGDTSKMFDLELTDGTWIRVTHEEWERIMLATQDQ